MIPFYIPECSYSGPLKYWIFNETSIAYGIKCSVVDEVDERFIPSSGDLYQQEQSNPIVSSYETQ